MKNKEKQLLIRRIKKRENETDTHTHKEKDRERERYSDYYYSC